MVIDLELLDEMTLYDVVIRWNIDDGKFGESFHKLAIFDFIDVNEHCLLKSLVMMTHKRLIAEGVKYYQKHLVTITLQVVPGVDRWPWKTAA